jgi:hypothetical protein
MDSADIHVLVEMVLTAKFMNMFLVYCQLNLTHLHYKKSAAFYCVQCPLWGPSSQLFITHRRTARGDDIHRADQSYQESPC